MALTLQEIAALYSEDAYKFGVYVSPQNLLLVSRAISMCNILTVERYKFEYSITDNLSFGKKGFYAFVLEDMNFPGLNLAYLLYIGKVEKTNSFKNRFYTYRNAIGKSEAAKNVVKLTNLWPDHTFVYFFELQDDAEIKDVEKILINKLKPHFNEEYFSQEAVETTNLYQLVLQTTT
jgi:hypothetical protein